MVDGSIILDNYKESLKTNLLLQVNIFKII